MLSPASVTSQGRARPHPCHGLGRHAPLLNAQKYPQCQRQAVPSLRMANTLPYRSGPLANADEMYVYEEPYSPGANAMYLIVPSTELGSDQSSTYATSTTRCDGLCPPLVNHMPSNFLVALRVAAMNSSPSFRMRSVDNHAKASRLFRLQTLRVVHRSSLQRRSR